MKVGDLVRLKTVAGHPLGILLREDPRPAFRRDKVWHVFVTSPDPSRLVLPYPHRSQTTFPFRESALEVVSERR